MSILKTQTELEPSGSRSAANSETLAGDSFPKRRRSTQRRPSDRPVTEEVLGEMGKALAKRLNALVDALDQQEPKP